MAEVTVYSLALTFTTKSYTITFIGLIIIIIMNFYSPVSNTKCHSIGHKMRIARIKIRVDSQGRWGMEPREESNFEKVCFELGTEYWQRRSFGYQEGVNSRVVDR